VKILITELWKLDVKIDYYCICKDYPIRKLGEFGKFKFFWLPDQFSPAQIYIYIFILENLSGSHNTMWILELIGSRKNVKSTQHWFGPMQVQHRVYKRGLNGPSELSFHINSLNIYMSHIFYISWSAYFAENFAMEQLEMESIINWFIYFLQKLAEGNGS